MTEALREHIGRRKQARIADLVGTVDDGPKQSPATDGTTREKIIRG